MPLLVFDIGVKGWSKLSPLLYLRNRTCALGNLIVVQLYTKVTARGMTRPDISADEIMLKVIEEIRTTFGYYPYVVTRDLGLATTLYKRDIPVFCIMWNDLLKRLGVDYVQQPWRDRPLVRKAFWENLLRKLATWLRMVSKKYEHHKIVGNKLDLDAINLCPPEMFCQIVELTHMINMSWRRYFLIMPIQFVHYVPCSYIVFTYDLYRRKLRVNWLVEITNFSEPRRMTRYVTVRRKTELIKVARGKTVKTTRLTFLRYIHEVEPKQEDIAHYINRYLELAKTGQYLPTVKVE